MLGGVGWGLVFLLPGTTRLMSGSHLYKNTQKRGLWVAHRRPESGVRTKIDHGSSTWVGSSGQAHLQNSEILEDCTFPKFLWWVSMKIQGINPCTLLEHFGHATSMSSSCHKMKMSDLEHTIDLFPSACRNITRIGFPCEMTSFLAALPNQYWSLKYCTR